MKESDVYTKDDLTDKPIIILNALLSWANEMQVKTAPKSALGRAIHYLLEQWPYLTRYLEDGRLELSNNRAERSIKPFVMGRKNWLFANTAGGAQASAVIYSLMETAKENALDPYRYLLWVLQNAPQLSEEDAAFVVHHRTRYSGGKFRNFPPLLSHVCPAALSFDGYGFTAVNSAVRPSTRWSL